MKKSSYKTNDSDKYSSNPSQTASVPSDDYEDDFDPRGTSTSTYIFEICGVLVGYVNWILVGQILSHSCCHLGGLRTSPLNALRMLLLKMLFIELEATFLLLVPDINNFHQYFQQSLQLEAQTKWICLDKV